MPIFHYTARDAKGQLVRELVAFNNEITLRDHLRKSNLFVLQIAEQQPRRRFSIGRRVGLGDLIIMSRQLRTMLNAGMPLVTGLEALSDQSPNGYLAEVITQVSRSVAQGNSLGAAMGEFPAVFPEMLLAFIRAGEEAGRLPENLMEASRQLELQMEVRQKTLTALAYPAFTLLATIGCVLFMLFYIVPVFKKIYTDLHARLPAMTQLLVEISNLLISTWWLALIVLVGLLVALKRYHSTSEGRLRIDGLKLKTPLFKTLFLKTASANLTGSLSGLLESGVPLVQALETAAGVCGNEVIAQAAREAARTVPLGRRLSDELEKSQLFPVMVVRMIAIAEDVGTLPMVLKEIAESYRQEVEYTLRRLLSLVEPAMVLVVAGVVGFVLVALYYPIFNIGNAMMQS
jgi:type II secretory pathway component PulF